MSGGDPDKDPLPPRSEATYLTIGPHAGDMLNFTVAANGMAKVTVTNKAVTTADGANSIYANGGTALMIHATADDGKTDPGGAAGDRIACGTITK